MWQTMADVWKAVKQLPNSEGARWVQLTASLLIAITAAWKVAGLAWRWARGVKAESVKDDWEPPEGA